MPILRYAHVTKQFAPDSYGLIDVSFQVEPGELVVITGHTGSGKTTLMKLLTREYSINQGELYFKETPVHALKASKVHLHRRQIGVVYQDYRLIKDLTVWENVALPLYIAGRNEDEIEQRTSDLLNLVKLSDKYELFPSQLSGGEAQRVSIARSLALAPELIFADEPTGNLDAETSRGIALLLAKINELGTTILLSTHDLTLIELFAQHRRLELAKGALIADSQRAAANGDPTVATSMGIPIKLDQTGTRPIVVIPTNNETHESTTTSTPTTPPTPLTNPEPVATPTPAATPALSTKRRFWQKMKGRQSPAPHAEEAAVSAAATTDTPTPTTPSASQSGNKKHHKKE